MAGPAVVAEPRDGWPLTGLSGVVIRRDGCLRLAGSQSAVMIWPAGGRWDKAAIAVVPADGGTIPDGAAVEGAGGAFTTDQLEPATPVGAAVLRCVDASEPPAGPADVVLLAPRLREDTDPSPALLTTTTLGNG